MNWYNKCTFLKYRRHYKFDVMVHVMSTCFEVMWLYHKKFILNFDEVETYITVCIDNITVSAQNRTNKKLERSEEFLTVCS